MSSIEGRYGSDHEILDGIIEYLRAEHGLTAELTDLPGLFADGCWFYTIEIDKSHELILEVRSGLLLVEEHIFVRGRRHIRKRAYELSNLTEFNIAIKMILKLVARAANTVEEPSRIPR